jgi:hypothetical protein
VQLAVLNSTGQTHHISLFPHGACAAAAVAEPLRCWPCCYCCCCFCLQCKTEVCVNMLQQHVARKKYEAGVWLMGHTSSDPTVDLAPDSTRKRKVRLVHQSPQYYCGCSTSREGCDWRAGSLTVHIILIIRVTSTLKAFSKPCPGSTHWQHLPGCRRVAVWSWWPLTALYCTAAAAEQQQQQQHAGSFNVQLLRCTVQQCKPVLDVGLGLALPASQPDLNHFEAQHFC